MYADLDLLEGGAAPIIGRKIVSLNNNRNYAVDRSRSIFINKKTRRKMRPVVRLDRNGKVKYRTAITLVDAIPATKKAAIRARRAARKRSGSSKTKTKATKTKATKTKATKTKATKTKKTKATKTKTKTKTKATKTKKEPIIVGKANPLTGYIKLNPDNPIMKRLKTTFHAMEDGRRAILRTPKK